MLRIVALDPGGTTGWAYLTQQKPHEEVRREDIQCGQLEGDNHHLQLYNMLGNYQVSDFVLVVEAFEYRNTSRAGLVLDSKEYIGVAKLFYFERMRKLGQQYQEQSASQAKGFVKDTHIKRLDLWSPGMPHAMDAMRHLIYFCANHSTMRGHVIQRQILTAAYKTKDK